MCVCVCARSLSSFMAKESLLKIKYLVTLLVVRTIVLARSHRTGTVTNLAHAFER